MTATEQVLQDEVTALQAKVLTLTSEIDIANTQISSLTNRLLDSSAELDATTEKLNKSEMALADIQQRASTVDLTEVRQSVAKIIFQNGGSAPTPEIWEQLKAWSLASNG